jgi:hypothetical protein
MLHAQEVLETTLRSYSHSPRPIPPRLRERVAVETNPWPVIASLGPQSVLERSCLDGGRITHRYVALTPQQL